MGQEEEASPCSLAHETTGQLRDEENVVEEEAEEEEGYPMGTPCSLAHETMRQLRDEEEEGCPCSPAHEISAWRLAQQGPRQESQGLS